MRPLRSRIVNRSSRPCVGWACCPSPGVDYATFDRLGQIVRRPGGRVPDDHDVYAHGLDVACGVAQAIRPLEADEIFAEKSRISAESRWAASVKLIRVRVLSSKNAVTTTRPRSAGTFLTLRVETSLKFSAVVEDVQDLLGGQLVERQQVLAGPHRFFDGCGAHAISTPSSPSTSRSLTRISLSGVVPCRRPTKSG